MGNWVQDDVLPDSRSKVIRDRKFIGSVSWVPIFCANCGVRGGRCPEENMNFIFYLCNKCAEKHGHIPGTISMPDEVFFRKMKEEQEASYGRYLTPDEMLKVIEENDSPLATLLIKG